MTILKTAGLILLTVLCLLLAALLLILLVPVRYRLSMVLPERADGIYAGGEGEKTKEGSCAGGLLRVSWLARLICFQASFQKGDGSEKDQPRLKARLTILGIPLWPRRKRNTPEKKGSEDSKRTEDPVNQKPGRKTAENTENTEKRQEPSSPKPPQPDPPPPPKVTPTAEEQIGRTDGRQERPSVLARIASAVRSFCERLQSLFTGSAHAAAILGEKAERLRQTWDYYQELFHCPETRRAADKILRHTKKLLRHVLPQRFSASLTLGTGDPASTANLLALHGMFYPLVGERIHITPDFDKACLAGELSARGRVRLCIPIYHLLTVLLDKRTWRLIRQLKKEEVANGR